MTAQIRRGKLDPAMGSVSPSPDDSGVVALGSVLDGRYRIESVLGKGGMGRVYRAEHTSLGRAVAIKVLHAQLGRSKEATARFQREALASGRLDHPNIVGVSDFGVLDDGSLYLVMEALEGEGLGTRLERDKRIAWPEAVEIIRGVLSGLRHAHDRGVVHRDIKPDNIFLARKDGDQIVKILDFGIAKLYANNAEDPATTRAGLTVGTPAYLSPEQAVGGAITPASDLYSTSVVLFEMLTGRVPFDEQDPLAMLTAHVGRDAPSFHEVAPDLDVPPGLEELVRRGLAKIADERIGSALEYRGALDDLLRAAGYEVSMMSGAVPRVSAAMAIASAPHSRPIAMTPAAGVVATPREVPAIPKRWVKIALAVGALASVVALALAVFDHGRRGAASPAGSAAAPAAVTSFHAMSELDRDTRLKAALHDLDEGTTCAERKAAIPELVDLGDKRAIPALKRARYRMVGGLLGIGASNSNGCLKVDAEDAIKQLEGR